VSISYISAELRRLVAARANYICEYCLIHEDDTLFGCEVDHIVSEKHGGPTAEHNLAYACLFCNRRKGSDLGSLVPGSNHLVRFFNPRIDRWPGHFALDVESLELISLTANAEATCRIFGLNEPDRLEERTALASIGRYPPAAAARFTRHKR
jgi:hypothetical protein